MKQLFLKGMLSLLVLIPSLAFAEMPQSWASKKVFVFPDAGRSPWLDAINNAESSIDMAAYKLSDVEVMEALKKAQKRGVAINLLIEPQVFKHAQSANITSPIEDLKKMGVKVYHLSKRFNQAHYKMIVVDKSWGLISTGNLDAESFDGIKEKRVAAARDFAIPLTDAAVIENLLTGFNADIQDQRWVPDQGKLVWGPDQQRSTFLKLINGAQKRIYIYQQDFQDEGIAQAVAGAARAGVEVKILMMPFPFDPKEDKNIPNQTLMTDAGCEIRLMENLYQHAKMMVVDDQMYAGSCNFYPNSMALTRELGILSDDADQINEVLTTFNKDWKDAKPFKGYHKTSKKKK